MIHDRIPINGGGNDVNIVCNTNTAGGHTPQQQVNPQYHHPITALRIFIAQNMLSEDERVLLLEEFAVPVKATYTHPNPNDIYYSGGIVVKATAYTNHPSETWGDPNITATGTRVTEGRTLAVSRDLFKRYGAGATVHIFDPDTGNYIGEYIIEDKMSSRFTMKVDIFMTSRKKALEFGVRRVRMMVVDE